jgi:hypothetical protein
MRFERTLYIAMISAAALGLAPETGAQYAGGPVANGGTISGTVKAKGKPPADEIKDVKKNVEQCGAKMAAQKYVVGPSGGLQYAVAMIEGIKAGKQAGAAGGLTYDNSACKFSPHVMVAPTGSVLKVRNSDDMLHNSHFFLVEGGKKKNLINLALPKKGQVLENNKILRKEGLISVECDAHDFMQGYIWSLPHPYGEVTGADGAFKLTDVPAGTYSLKVWHEALGEKIVSVTVEAGKDAKVAVEL